MKKSTVIIGASGGIGLALAETLALDNDRDLVCTYFSQESSSSRFFKGVDWQYLDVTNEDSVLSFIKKFKNFNEIIFCSGIVNSNLLGNYSKKQIDLELDVNLSGPMFFINQVLEKLLKNGTGTIIFIGSVVAVKTFPGLASYSASKVGLVSLCRSINRELIMHKKKNPHDIRCVLISPGYVKTKMTENLPTKVQDRINDNSVLGRMIEPQEVANIISFILNTKSKVFAGAEIYFDGGLYT